MFIPFLLIIILLSTQVYGMDGWVLYKEIRKTPHTKLKPCSYNPDNIGSIINFADKSGDGHAMAKLIYICLPKEVIEAYIAPHLTEPIATNFKHKLITHKAIMNSFPIKKINYNGFISVSCHDGTWPIVPNTGHKYALWAQNGYMTQQGIGVLNCLTGYHFHNNNENRVPLIIWSNQNKLIIRTCRDGTWNRIKITKSYADADLGTFTLAAFDPIEMGLTADEKSIIFLQKDKTVYQLDLYNNRDSNHFDFIEQKANIVQLYDMLNIGTQSKNATRFVKTMKSYIARQQKLDTIEKL